MAQRLHRRLAAILAVASCVVVLLFGCSPATVSKFVVPVVIPTVKRVELGWSPPHVRQEVLKFQPTVADRNSSATIEIPYLMVLVATAREHICPCSILWGLFPVGTFAMSNATFPKLDTKISSEASTRFRSPVAQHATSNDLFISAFAPAQPTKFFARSVPGELKDCPSAEDFTSDVVCHAESVTKQG